MCIRTRRNYLGVNMRRYDNKNINYDKLIKYGFKIDGNNYIYNKKIHNDEFNVIVSVSDKEVTSKIVELDSNEEYVLVDTSSTGSFVLELNNEYEDVINSVFSNCLDNYDLSNEVISYIKNKYGDELEYLWEKFPSYAVIRNKSNNKWYALIAKIEKNKLIGESKELIWVLNLRCDSDIVDNVNIFPGYHMNKKSWISIDLCGNIDIEDVYNLIDKSYELSGGK